MYEEIVNSINSTEILGDSLVTLHKLIASSAFDSVLPLADILWGQCNLQIIFF